jgi:hypothetical protein
MTCECMKWAELTQDTVQCQYFMNMMVTFWVCNSRRCFDDKVTVSFQGIHFTVELISSLGR